MKLTAQQEALFEFVKEWHGDQKRKYSLAPYWTHLYAVAQTASSILKSDGVIEIALCHDLLEDTPCTKQQLADQLKTLGYNAFQIKTITQGVVELTDVFVKENFPELNRKERRKKEAVRLGKTSSMSQSIKYADLIDNTRTIATDDPGFARMYLNEIMDILDHMRNGDIRLLVNCCYTVKTAQLILYPLPEAKKVS